jgi:hypothetical protein
MDRQASVSIAEELKNLNMGRKWWRVESAEVVVFDARRAGYPC